MDCHTNINERGSGLHNFFIESDKNRSRNTRSVNTKLMEVKNIKTVTGRKAYSF